MAGTGTAHLRDGADVVLRVEHLVVEFPAGHGGTVHAVADVSFDVVRGETLGLVGESGCGKSTTGRAIMQLPPPTSGRVRFDGRRPGARCRRTELRDVRRAGADDLPGPDLVAEPAPQGPRHRRRAARRVGQGQRAAQARVDEVLEAVGLDPAQVGDRRPHQFSGGQCQRISIARALVLDPELLICDEPVSALDVSVQAQILNLLEAMKARYGLTLLFIAHDLAVVRNISDRVAVMYLGKLCEVADSAQPVRRTGAPVHRAAAVVDPDRATVARQRCRPPDATMPSPLAPPSGCRFRTRCPRADDTCAAVEPVLREVARDGTSSPATTR